MGCFVDALAALVSERKVQDVQVCLGSVLGFFEMAVQEAGFCPSNNAYLHNFSAWIVLLVPMGLR